MEKLPISVIIQTKNEAVNIKHCSETIYGWVDEIIIVDDLSSDDTVKIAAQFADKILVKKMGIEGVHRNWAYAQAKNSWVLVMDADERITPELKEELKIVLDNTKGFTAYTIPHRNYIGNSWVKYGGWYPNAQIRLFKKEKFKLEEVDVHPRVFLEGRCGHLKGDVIHYSYKNFEDFLNKLNRQTTLEATKWIRTNRKMSMPHAFWRAVDRFFRRFIRKKGYRDGFLGFMLAFFDTIYQIVSYAKYWELKTQIFADEKKRR